MTDQKKERAAAARINRIINSCIHKEQLIGANNMIAGFASIWIGSKYFEPLLQKSKFKNKVLKYRYEKRTN